MDLKTLRELNYEDINLYYHDTFIRIGGIKKGTSWEWVMVRGANPDRSMEVDDERGRRFRIFPQEKLGEMDFSMPESGIYPFKDSIVYVQKIPRRQNKKAVSCETYGITKFYRVFQDTHLSKLFNGRNFVFCSEHLNDLFERGKYAETLREAWKSVKNKDIVCVPMDRNFSLSSGIYDDSPVLWYRFIPVAKMKRPDLLAVCNKLFFQEVIDKFSLKENIKIQIGD